MVHNPLTISNEMKKLGFVVEGIYFYHFHPVPPFFENLDKMYFRKKSMGEGESYRLEGFLTASGFVVDCKKI